MTRTAALLLGVACVAWVAVPASDSAWGALAFATAIAGVVAGSLRLYLAEVPYPEDQFLLSWPARFLVMFLRVLRDPPWEEIAVAALVLLEVLHPSRPWHTAALGAAAVAYLLTVHIAESDADPARLLRGHAKVLIAGACLLALAAGAALLPGTAPGTASALLRVLSAAAIIAAAALILPA